MGRVRWRVKKIIRNKGEYPGRPAACGNEPGETACLKRLRGAKNVLCRECRAEGARAAKKRVFGW